MISELVLSKELGYDIFPFSEEDFETNPFLEQNLRNILKKLNKENKNHSLYDLKSYYLFFYNIYVEKKMILPLFFLNDSKDSNLQNLISFNSLFSLYNIEIFNGNNINLAYNTYISHIRNNGILFDDFIEKKIKKQIIFYNLIKKYLKCNKITFLIITELL